MPDDRAFGDFGKPLTDVAEQSFTLPARWYLDADIYEMEKERIFYRTWQYVGHLSLLESPGDYVAIKICDQGVFVIRGDDGALCGFYNVCQHRAHELLPLGEGNVARAIVCPYHAWTFAKDGALRGAPQTGRRPGFDKSAFSLKPVRVEEFLGCVFVNLDPDATSLAELASDLEQDVRAHLPFFDQARVPEGASDPVAMNDTQAGWKVVVDNYVECYHCDHAHPSFADLICMDSYQHQINGLWARQYGPEISDDNSAYPLAKDAPNKKSVFWFLWPNTTINVLPGVEQVNFAAVRPTGLATSDFTGHTASVTDGYDQVAGDYTRDVLIPEDLALCESVQRGLRSFGYEQGPFVADGTDQGRGEHVLHHFHRLVKEALTT